MNIPIYVINLERSAARRAEMTRQLSGLALPFEIVNAIDGKKVDRTVLEKDYSSSESRRLHGRDLTPNEIACSLSHISVYERMAQERIRCSVILEDDVQVEVAFKTFVSKLPHMMNDDWGILNLFSDQKSTPFGDPVFGIYRYSRFQGPCNRTAAYALKLSGAERLLECARPIRFAADGLTGKFRETGIGMLGILPKLVGLKNFPSDIGPRRPKKAD
jgi:glycosyl transferase, family 25